MPYTIKVETGPGKDSGTNANAFIILKGPSEKKTTGKLPLILLDKDAYEPNCTEIFSVQAPDIGEIQEITVGVFHMVSKVLFLTFC